MTEKERLARHLRARRPCNGSEESTTNCLHTIYTDPSCFANPHHNSAGMDTTSNPQSGFDWEDACLDPHHDSLEQGRSQGREAGGLAGFREGEALGRTKGLEFGLEVGFYRGIVSVLLSRQPSHTQRIQNSIEKLRKAIDDFPSPDELFLRVGTANSSLLDAAAVTNTTDDDSETLSRFDVLNRLQRIRAYYKLVAVQVGKPQFSLRNALERPVGETAETDNGYSGW